MKKNIASQKIGAQLVSATDGSSFTGSVTVAVTGDAGTQATGSVGSGACTHEGGGYHTYAPSQAETNYDLVAFTFSGTGAVPVTVQVYTRAATESVSIASGGITAASFATDSIAAAAVKADAVTKIQAGLATPTNITAGTITTVTNLTNAPTSGDLTAAMIASVTTATLDTTDVQGACAAAVDAAMTTYGLDKIDGMLETDGSGGFQFTTLAVENAPSGTGASAATIADAVWDELVSGHVVSGSFGEGVLKIGVAYTHTSSNGSIAPATATITKA